MPADLVRLALASLRRDPRRALLTILAVALAVATVTALMALGRGASARIEERIASLGADVITLLNGQGARGGGGAAIHAKPFDYRDVEAIRAHVPHVRHVAPLAARSVRVTVAGSDRVTRALGTENGYLRARNWGLERGRLFSAEETRSGRPVCLLGRTLERALFSSGDSVGSLVRIGGLGCEVIGTLAPRGQSGGADEDDVVAMPFDTFQRRVQGSPDIESIVISARDPGMVTRVTRQIAELMRERRGLAAGERANFTLLDSRTVTEAAAHAAATTMRLLIAIGAISLLVGGIGIVNVMLVSVRERTREIGVKLAIGATPRQIRFEVLAEVVALSVVGGAFGAALGIAAARGAAMLFQSPFLIEPGVIGLAMACALALGLLSGLGPAVRAASLDPVRALRSN